MNKNLRYEWPTETVRRTRKIEWINHVMRGATWKTNKNVFLFLYAQLFVRPTTHYTQHCNRSIDCSDSVNVCERQRLLTKRITNWIISICQFYRRISRAFWSNFTFAFRRIHAKFMSSHLTQKEKGVDIGDGEEDKLLMPMYIVQLWNWNSKRALRNPPLCLLLARSVWITQSWNNFADALNTFDVVCISCKSSNVNDPNLSSTNFSFGFSVQPISFPIVAKAQQRHVSCYDWISKREVLCYPKNKTKITDDDDEVNVRFFCYICISV